MLIDPATFHKKRKSKRPPMSLADVAIKAGVSERTLARIKKREDMHASTVEKIATALDTSVEELCAPPRTQGDRRKGGFSGEYLAQQIELVAARYDVAPEVIEELAPLMFVAIAERALENRKERLEAWWKKVKKLKKISPKFNTISIAELEAESGISSLEQAYLDEMEQIENKCLDGWATDDSDHFFEALYGIGGFDNLEFNDRFPEIDAPVTDGGWNFEGKMPDGSLPYPLESLKNFGNQPGLYVGQIHDEAAGHIAGYEYIFYNPLDEDGEGFFHPLTNMAEDRLLYGDFVPLSQMPIELRRKDKTIERAKWIVSYGSDQPIPDVYQHFEAVCRINAYQHHQENARELADQLEGAAAEERAAIQEELEAAREKAAAWKALIMPDDNEWHAKWVAHCEAKEMADCEEELE